MRVVPVLLLSGLAGCGILPSADETLPDRKVEYKKEKMAERNLEIPPDLTKSSIDDALMVPDITPSGTATYSDYMGERTGMGAAKVVEQGVLPKIEDVSVMRDRDQRWLLVQAPADQVWDKVTSFWQENGILMEEQNPAVGVMRTTWIENRADIKTDFITRTIRKAFDGLYAAATRDQYRVRLEQGEQPGTTEVFLTHQGMEEQLVTGASGEAQQSVWIPRGTDTELEAEMLRRLMMYFGVAEKRADSALARKTAEKPRSQLVRGQGLVALRIEEGASRAWRLTGLALDRSGFAVEDQDRSKGLYYVRYNDPMKEQKDPGFMSKLAFWRNDENIDKENQYQVSLRPEQDGATQVVVLNSAGAVDNSETAVRILTLLHEQIQ